MLILQLECATEEKDVLVAELWEHGTSGITEQDPDAGRVLLSAYFEERFDVAGLAAFAPRWEDADERDWVAVSRSQWASVLVGERFFLVPDWISDPTPVGRLRVEMHPGQACGTGWHAATQLCLEALERYLRPGDALLDVGTGSGILSSAAAMLGAGTIYACDVDGDAIAIARDRLRQERASAGFFTGSAGAVKAGIADVVVANISAAAVIELEPEFTRALRPGGRLIVSGFPEQDLAAVRTAYPRVLEVLELDGWIALVR